MTKEITIIAAMLSPSQGIGVGGKLPWKSIPTDMKHFTEKTTGHTVVMGSKTFWSIPKKFRPLPDRTTIVVTNNTTVEYPPEVIIASSIDEAIQKAPTQLVFLIGGEGIFKEAMERLIAGTIILTKVFGLDMVCDTFFPHINHHNWQLFSEGPRIKDETSELEVQFVTYKNRFTQSIE